MTDENKYVSPDDLLEAAIQMELHGVPPQTWEDKARVLNFVAFNVLPSVAAQVTPLFAMIYGWEEFSREECIAIADYQVCMKIAAGSGM